MPNPIPLSFNSTSAVVVNNWNPITITSNQVIWSDSRIDVSPYQYNEPIEFHDFHAQTWLMRSSVNSAIDITPIEVTYVYCSDGIRQLLRSYQVEVKSILNRDEVTLQPSDEIIETHAKQVAMGYVRQNYLPITYVATNNGDWNIPGFIGNLTSTTGPRVTYNGIVLHSNNIDEVRLIHQRRSIGPIEEVISIFLITVSSIQNHQYGFDGNCITPNESIKQTIRKNSRFSNVSKRVERRILLTEAQANEVKARETLRDMLTESEWRKYVTNGFVMVKGQSLWYQVFARQDRIKLK